MTLFYCVRRIQVTRGKANKNVEGVSVCCKLTSRVQKLKLWQPEVNNHIFGWIHEYLSPWLTGAVLRQQGTSTDAPRSYNSFLKKISPLPTDSLACAVCTWSWLTPYVFILISFCLSFFFHLWYTSMWKLQVIWSSNAKRRGRRPRDRLTGRDIETQR